MWLDFVICIGIIFNAIETNAQKRDRTLNLNLEAVFEFKKDNSADMEIINGIQGLLNKLKHAMTKKSNKLSGRKDMKFSDFIKEAAITLRSFDDDALDKVRRVVRDEIVNGYRFRSRADELFDNPDIGRIIADTTDKVKKVSVEDVRKYLAAAVKFIDTANSDAKQNVLINYINSWFNKNDMDKLKTFLRKLKVDRNSKTIKGELENTLRRGVKSIIVDHFNTLDDKSKNAIKTQLKALAKFVAKSAPKVPDIKENAHVIINAAKFKPKKMPAVHFSESSGSAETSKPVDTEAPTRRLKKVATKDTIATRTKKKNRLVTYPSKMNIKKVKEAEYETSEDVTRPQKNKIYKHTDNISSKDDSSVHSVEEDDIKSTALNNLSRSSESQEKTTTKFKKLKSQDQTTDLRDYSTEDAEDIEDSLSSDENNSQKGPLNVTNHKETEIIEESSIEEKEQPAKLYNSRNIKPTLTTPNQSGDSLDAENVTFKSSGESLEKFSESMEYVQKRHNRKSNSDLNTSLKSTLKVANENSTLKNGISLTNEDIKGKIKDFEEQLKEFKAKINVLDLKNEMDGETKRQDEEIIVSEETTPIFGIFTSITSSNLTEIASSKSESDNATNNHTEETYNKADSYHTKATNNDTEEITVSTTELTQELVLKSSNSSEFENFIMERDEKGTS